MREHRPAHGEMTPEQRKAANARSYANVYERRGKLGRKPCEDCGAMRSEKHHHDYDQPLEVTWLCRPCHLAEHHRWLNPPVAYLYRVIRRDLLAA